jgi:hypothetical protein
MKKLKINSKKYLKILILKFKNIIFNLKNVVKILIMNIYLFSIEIFTLKK